MILPEWDEVSLSNPDLPEKVRMNWNWSYNGMVYVHHELVWYVGCLAVF